MFDVFLCWMYKLGIMLNEYYKLRNADALFFDNNNNNFNKRYQDCN